MNIINFNNNINFINNNYINTNTNTNNLLDASFEFTFDLCHLTYWQYRY